MITNSKDLIKGINKFLQSYKTDKIRLSGVTLNKSVTSGKYFECRINGQDYWLKFEDDVHKRPENCFIHLYDSYKDRPSVVQFTIDKSNFKIDKTKFWLIQNRGTTIGKGVLGLTEEFRTLMTANGFNHDNIITSGNCSKPNYLDIVQQIFTWLEIRVNTKLQLEEKYRDIEDRAFENETDFEYDDINEIESRTEGGIKVVISVKAERDSRIREEAINIHGLKCKGCGFDFEEKYGVWGKNYIEVHHVIPLGNGKKRLTNPRTDLTVVCSNCHRMIHRNKKVTLTIEELKLKIR